LVGVWDDDPERGRRAILRGEIRGTTVYFVLYPAGEDEFNLGSAYPDQ